MCTVNRPKEIGMTCVVGALADNDTKDQPPNDTRERSQSEAVLLSSEAKCTQNVKLDSAENSTQSAGVALTTTVDEVPEVEVVQTTQRAIEGQH